MADGGHGNDLDERVGDAVEVEEVGRRGLIQRLGGILFHLDLFDRDGDAWRVCGIDAIVGVEGDVAVFGEGLCGGKDLADALWH